MGLNRRAYPRSKECLVVANIMVNDIFRLDCDIICNNVERFGHANVKQQEPAFPSRGNKPCDFRS